MRKKMMSIGASSVTLPKHLQTADPKQITLQGSDNSLLHVQGSQVDLEDLVAAIDSGETDLWLQPDVRTPPLPIHAPLRPAERLSPPPLGAGDAPVAHGRRQVRRHAAGGLRRRRHDGRRRMGPGPG